MADTRNITLTITGGLNGKGVQTPDVDDDLYGNQSSPSNKALVGKSVFLHYALNKVNSVSKQAAEASLRRYFSLREDYVGEAIYNNAKDIVGEVTGSVGAVVGAAKFLGPAGAATTATALVIGKGISTASEYSAIRQGVNSRNYNMQFQQTRMGLIDGGRGTEN